MENGEGGRVETNKERHSQVGAEFVLGEKKGDSRRRHRHQTPIRKRGSSVWRLEGWK